MRLIRLAALAGAVWYLRDARRRQQLVDRVKGLWQRRGGLASGSDDRFESHSVTPPAAAARPQDVVSQTPSG